MTYKALYRAWRPQTFADVTGQMHVTRTLQNSLRQKKFSHAYLFSGPRGIGKTSIAKIFAKAINCAEGQPEEPCNACPACRAITNGELMDVTEIDAASNRGVDEIRDLRDQVKYAPTEVAYKVYIIDEVHMLTNEAFNALLKTLEEPPSHVVFILATTEPHKLPLTVISRCQRFDFQRISNEDIIQRLRYISEELKIEFEEGAFELIAYSAEGGLRDALGMLDQALAFGNNILLLEHVQAITGSIDQSLLVKLVGHIADQQVSEALCAYDGAILEGKDPKQLMKDMMHFTRDLLLLKITPEMAEVQHRGIGTDENKKLAARFTDQELIDMLEKIAKADNEAKFINQPRVLVELLLVRLCRRAPAAEAITINSGNANITEEYLQQIQKLQRQVESLEQKVQQGFQEGHSVASSPTMASKAQTRKNLAKATLSNEKLAEMFQQNNQKVLAKISSHWSEVLDRVKKKKITLHAWLTNGEPVAVYQQYIVLAFQNEIHRETADQLENRQLIESVIVGMTSKPFQIMTVLASEWKQAVEGTNNTSGATAEQDACVNKAIELFGEEFVEIKE